ncbi:hypothetical protein Tco_0539935 [Tanacetum coccineum]
MKRCLMVPCYASSAITYIREPLESCICRAYRELGKFEFQLRLQEFIELGRGADKLPAVKPPRGVRSISAAKQSGVNDEPIKTKISSFIKGQRRPRIVLLSRSWSATWVLVPFKSSLSKVKRRADLSRGKEKKIRKNSKWSTPQKDSKYEKSTFFDKKEIKNMNEKK